METTAARPERDGKRTGEAGRPAVLEATGICKSFGVVQALGGVSVDFVRGEVHALVGENGAGKSTLAKIVGGAERPDAGELRLGGEPVTLASPSAALAAGVSVVYQDLNLAPELTVAANLFLAREPRGPLGVNDNAMNRRAARLLERLGATFPPDVRVADLSTGDRQLAEIARALNHEPSLLIMDEPTASLSQPSAERLFAVIGELKAAGVSVLYVTHELAHVFELADRVTVLKDGALMMTKQVLETSRDEVIETMVGRRVGDLFPKRTSRDRDTAREPALEVSNLTLPGYFESVSFKVDPGEIVGLGGLVGSGRTRVAQAIFGVLPEQRYGHLSGRILIGGKEVAIKSPRAAVRRGVGYVPEDRKVAGLVLELTVANNLSLPQLERVSRFGLLDRDREAELARREIESLRIRTQSAATRVANLSGGNQQKVVLGKWLALGTSIMMLDEPTPGVDIGAKAEIYSLIARIADEGAAVLLISSDLPELLGLSDRILVMSKGRIVAHEHRTTATEERIVRAAFGGHPDRVIDG